MEEGLLQEAQPKNSMIFKTFKLFQDLSMQQHLELLHHRIGINLSCSKGMKNTKIIEQTNKYFKIQLYFVLLPHWCEILCKSFDQSIVSPIFNL